MPKLRKLNLPPKDRCLICMESLTYSSLRGYLDCTHHIFCYNCVATWAQQANNNCPLCKKKFYLITGAHVDQSGIQLTHITMRVVDKSLKVEINEIPYIDVRCEVCGSDLDDEIMLLCDDCDKGFHTTCIGLKEIPHLEQWFCPACIVSKPEEIKLEWYNQLKNTRDPQMIETPHRLSEFSFGHFDIFDQTFESISRQINL